MQRKKYFLICLFVFAVTDVTYAGWPLNRTPAIEGYITDSVTGKPIENVVLAAEWQKLGFELDGGGYGTHSIRMYITDKNGYFKIPERTTIHIIEAFYQFTVKMIHPLYVTDKFGLYTKDESNRKIEMIHQYSPDTVKAWEEYDKYGYGFSGIEISTYTYKWINKHQIRCDMKLMSLEEKYINRVIDRSENNLEKLTNEFIGSLTLYENAWYFKELKERKLHFNIDEIAGKWKLISANLSAKREREKAILLFLENIIDKSELKAQEVIENK